MSAPTVIITLPVDRTKDVESHRGMPRALIASGSPVAARILRRTNTTKRTILPTMMVTSADVRSIGLNTLLSMFRSHGVGFLGRKPSGESRSVSQSERGKAMAYLRPPRLSNGCDWSSGRLCSIMTSLIGGTRSTRTRSALADARPDAQTQPSIDGLRLLPRRFEGCHRPAQRVTDAARFEDNVAALQLSAGHWPAKEEEEAAVLVRPTSLHCGTRVPSRRPP